MSRGLDDGPGDRIAANRRRFDELVTRADANRASGRLEDAAVIAQVAAALAWHSPTGLFASSRLESLLVAISPRFPAPDRAARSHGDFRRVLHVLTTAYRVGGHTRLAARWIERDDGRVHSLALTRQANEPLPASLLEAVRARGGQIHRVDRAASGLIRRAEALQAAVAQADVVVLHTHPFDVVPSIALAGLDRIGRRPPTILLNHADHLFWIGLTASDLVLHLRASGARLSFARRSLSPDRSAILPVPLALARPTVGREASRRRMGYEESEILAVSVASGYKYGEGYEDGPLPLLARAIEHRANLRVLAVGPGNRPDWQLAGKRTGGRVRSLDLHSDLAEIYGSADIYLDSYPFSSLTSMLEAGQRGVPLLAYADAGPAADVLAFDDPALEGLVEPERTTDGFLGALEQLVDDPKTRRERGQQIELALSAHHAGVGWQDHLEHAYARATIVHESPRREFRETADPVSDTSGELDRRLVILLDAQQADAPRGVRGHVLLAPFSVRVEEWRRSRRTARPLSVFALLPERALRLARRAGILARSLRRAVRLGGQA